MTVQIVRFFGGACWHVPLERDAVLMMCSRDVRCSQVERVEVEHTRDRRVCTHCHEEMWRRFMCRMAAAR